MIDRDLFDTLVLVNENSKLAKNSNTYDLNQITNHINGSLLELKHMGYIDCDNRITEKGNILLESFCCKKAIFMAAGMGSRLKPITDQTPKPLVRVDGVRIIDRLIDSCLFAGIEEIYIVRGYLAEQFDELLNKYPMIRFIENTTYGEANNIGSIMAARHLLSNAYVFEADLLISNPKIIKKYHYRSDFLAIKKNQTDDWCFKVQNGIITDEMKGGNGEDIWQMVGISYWNEDDGKKLYDDVAEKFSTPEGKTCFWEQVPLVYYKDRYNVEVSPCHEEDVVEIDTFDELVSIDSSYRSTCDL